jgi:Zn-dependent peptidase ImmA (M78 family)
MKIRLQPEVLRWARERARLDIPTLAEKLGVKPERVEQWEQSGELTFAQAENLARATRLAFGYLFLREAPEEKLPIPDLRTVGSQGIERASTELLDVVAAALRCQDWYRDYLLTAGEEPLPFVGSLSGDEAPENAAARVREVVQWDAEQRGRAVNWEQAQRLQIDSVESAGILVMRSGIAANNTHRPLSVEEFRGFALCDPHAPLIFVNTKDAAAAQMFTLAHELVHIWLGVSGVSNLEKTLPSSLATERFCNAVAAELLAPATELRQAWLEVRHDPDRVRALSRRFKVSSLVVLRRLHDLKVLNRDEFGRHYADEVRRYQKAARGGGSHYRNVRTRLGRRFVRALVESTLEGRTLYRDAFRLLGVKNTDGLRELAREMDLVA